MNNEIRSINNLKKPIGFYFKANWIFSSRFEKILLTVFIGLATWKAIDIIRLIF